MGGIDYWSPVDKPILSLVNPAVYTKQANGVCEESILHLKDLPRFKENLSLEDSESLLSYLTVPFMAAPLVLSFFAKDRVGILLHKPFRALIEAVLFEPRMFKEDFEDLLTVPVDPSSKETLLGTRYGVLVNELIYSPDSIFSPLLAIGRGIVNLCIGDYRSSFVSVLEFICRTMVRIGYYFKYIESTKGTSEGFVDADFRFPDSTQNLWREILDFLTVTAASLLYRWLAQADLAEKTNVSTRLHCHIAMILSLFDANEMSHQQLVAYLSRFIVFFLWDLSEKKKKKSFNPSYLFLLL